jgi:hypothetical protein
MPMATVAITLVVFQFGGRSEPVSYQSRPPSPPNGLEGGALRTLRGRCFAAAMMHLNANLPAACFGVPPAQVVEVGLEVEI